MKILDNMLAVSNFRYNTFVSKFLTPSQQIELQLTPEPPKNPEDSSSSDSFESISELVIKN